MLGAWKQENKEPSRYSPIGFRHANEKDFGSVKIQAHLVLLCFASLCFSDIVFFWYKLNFCGNSGLSKSIGAIFPIAFAHVMSVCHFLGILIIFQTLLLHLLEGSVITAHWKLRCSDDG